MPKCYMLIGVPGSGKSTIVKKLKEEFPEIEAISTDEYIEKKAKENNSNYDKMHREHIDDATKWFKVRLRQLINKKLDFILDQTNVVKTARMKKLRDLKSNKYEAIGIYFNLEREEIEKRLKARVESGGKIIYKKILDNMIESYTLPDYEEGFSLLYEVKADGVLVEKTKPNVIEKKNIIKS